MIGDQPDMYDSIALVDRLRLMVDFYRPAGHSPLTPEALATVISQQTLKNEMQSDEIARFLDGRAESLAPAVRDALCDLIGVPRAYLESEKTTDQVKMVTVQLQIAIGIRDRGINYLAGRKGYGSSFSQLRQVLETIRSIPVAVSHSQQFDTETGKLRVV